MLAGGTKLRPFSESCTAHVLQGASRRRSNLYGVTSLEGMLGGTPLRPGGGGRRVWEKPLRQVPDPRSYPVTVIRYVADWARAGAGVRRGVVPKP